MYTYLGKKGFAEELPMTASRSELALKPVVGEQPGDRALYGAQRIKSPEKCLEACGLSHAPVKTRDIPDSSCGVLAVWVKGAEKSATLPLAVIPAEAGARQLARGISKSVGKGVGEMFRIEDDGGTYLGDAVGALGGKVCCYCEKYGRGKKDLRFSFTPSASWEEAFLSARQASHSFYLGRAGLNAMPAEWEELREQFVLAFRTGSEEKIQEAASAIFAAERSEERRSGPATESELWNAPPMLLLMAEVKDALESAGMEDEAGRAKAAAAGACQRYIRFVARISLGLL